jgi:hypothetical protein
MSTTSKRKTLFAAAAAICATVSIPVPATAQADAQIVRLQGGGLRFLDAHEITDLDYNAVTRPFQGFDTTQQWRLTPGRRCQNHPTGQQWPFPRRT